MGRVEVWETKPVAIGRIRILVVPGNVVPYFCAVERFEARLQRRGRHRGTQGPLRSVYGRPRQKEPTAPIQSSRQRTSGEVP